MKLQAGMAFECEINGDKVRGRIFRESLGEKEFYISYRDRDGREQEKYINDRLNKITNVTNFRIIPITLDLLQVGDVIINSRRGGVIINSKRNERTILARVNDLVHISMSGNPKKVNDFFTISELKDLDYSVVQPEWEEKPKARGMTLREIELELGYKIRIEEVTP